MTYPITAARIESNLPCNFRLCKRGGIYVLQGCYKWEQGSNYGFDWRDIETVIEDE